MTWTRIATLLLLGSACAGAPVYRSPPRGSVDLGPPPPIAAGAGPALAIVTLADRRPVHFREPLASWVEEQGGWSGSAGTRDSSWSDPVPELFTARLAAAIAATGRFREVRQVDDSGEVEEGLVLTGLLRAFRGWQGYHVRSGEAPRILASVGEAYVDSVEVVAAGSGRLVFAGQTGGFLEGTSEPLDPYRLAELALDEAATRLARQLAEADLDAPLAREVRLDPMPVPCAPGAARPEGWSVSSEDASAPHGWSGAPACETWRFEDDTRFYFHPRLGEYRGHFALWRCPKEHVAKARYSGPNSVRFPAEVVGRDAAGRVVLLRRVGATTWPEAPQDLRACLGLSTPPGPVLRLPITTGRRPGSVPSP